MIPKTAVFGLIRPRPSATPDRPRQGKGRLTPTSGTRSCDPPDCQRNPSNAETDPGRLPDRNNFSGLVEEPQDFFFGTLGVPF